MGSVVFARPGAIPPLAGWFYKDLELLKFLHLKLAVMHMKAQQLWLMHMSPTMPYWTVTTALLLRLLLPGAVQPCSTPGVPASQQK